MPDNDPDPAEGSPARTVRCDGAPDEVSALVDALAEALDGGPAVLPWAAADGPAPVVRAAAPAGAALVVSTSGSTGEAKRVVLTAAALRASATATHTRLGGPGRWLLPLPAHHVAGVQVIVRGLLAGHRPAVLDNRAGFRPERFASAVGALLAESGGGRHYTSLVPTQLHRVLAEPASGGLDALRRFDAVLVGGAATPPRLLARAREAGVAVVTTYGMSETAGGCVYDGVPLDGVTVRLAEPDGRIRLGGPTLALGYLDAPGPTAEAFRDGWFATSDLGAWSPDGRLRVLGRADDVITTGGKKVHPAAVERVLAAQPGVRAACVVGLDDPEWGQRVAAAVVLDVPPGPDRSNPAPGGTDERVLREAVRAALGTPATPRTIRTLPELPLRGVGKPDRAEVARLLRAAD
ncbi:MAG TPA: o-succinylbenzoate--CoA ligase [Pseudonocardia sp.]|jgi:O-succinylbenzoic acid--CoA ligase